MKELQIFNSTEFGSVRTLSVDGTPFFVGKDVADILEYQNGSRDINRHTDEDDRLKIMIFDGNQSKETIVINESGLYSLILSSKMPTAKRFKHWVTAEILPAIRKHGAYLTTETLEKVMNDPDAWIRVLTELKNERSQKERLQLEAAESKHKVVFADAVSVSETTILIGELAKLLKGNGMDIGQNRLFKRLRQEGYLIKRKGTDYNAPTQMAMEIGLFKVKETVITHSDGHTTISKTTKVTGKGQQYFINRFLGKEVQS